MPYPITARDRATFKRCRRAWDLGSRMRQNYEPLAPPRPFDFEEALRYALSVYYFPAMWDWNRAIVRRIVLEGFVKSMREQREQYHQEHGLTSDQIRDWGEAVQLGESLLRGYFEWAPTVDHFDAIRVQADLDVNIPDPLILGEGLVTPDGDPIHYRDRIELMVVDEDDLFWLVRHRLADPDWAEEDQLVLDEEMLAQCWACEVQYLKLRIAGTIYNELRTDVPPPAPADETGPDEAAWPERSSRRWSELSPEPASASPTAVIDRHTTDHFRRTKIPRSRAEVDGFGRQLARLAQDVTELGVRVYPNPAWEHCHACAYRSPCIAMNQGGDVDGVLAASYRQREPERVEGGRIGGSSGTWFLRW